MNTTPEAGAPATSAAPASPADSPELLTLFGRIKGHLLTEQTAFDAVNGLARVARDVVGPAEGAGVSMMDTDGNRQSVGATDPRVQLADDLQYEFHQGPCISAWSSGDPVYIADTGSDQRWPDWTSAVRPLGVRSCLSVPLLGTPSGLGAMKVYSNTVDAFSGEDRELLITLARSTAALLGHIQSSDTPQRISQDIKASLVERDTIGIARGILMERFDLDRQSAMNHLIDLATDASTTVTLVAAMISERQDGIHVTPDA